MSETVIRNLSFGEALKYAALGDDIHEESQGVAKGDRQIYFASALGADRLCLIDAEDGDIGAFSGVEVMSNRWVATTTEGSV